MVIDKRIAPRGMKTDQPLDLTAAFEVRIELTTTGNIKL